MNTNVSIMQGKTERLWSFLKFLFVVVPIVAGADKFFNVLADWSDYLSAKVEFILPFSVSLTMSIVGVIEIMAGLCVMFFPRFGGFLVMTWLILIGINLLMAGFYDIAVRDFVMAGGAYSLAKLTEIRRAMIAEYGIELPAEEYKRAA